MILLGFPRLAETQKILPDGLRKGNMSMFQWTVESETFPMFCRLLHVQEYRERVILGEVLRSHFVVRSTFLNK